MHKAIQSNLNHEVSTPQTLALNLPWRSWYLFLDRMCNGIWNLKAMINVKIKQGSHWHGKSGKTWKNKVVKESQGHFFYLSKKSGNLKKKKKKLINVKLKNVVISIWKMLQLSFHTSRKSPKMVREICVRSGSIFSDIWWELCQQKGMNQWHGWMLCKYSTKFIICKVTCLGALFKMHWDRPALC